MAQTSADQEFLITHVNIRQSITFLISKLILIDMVAAFLTLVFFSPVFLPFITNDFRIAVLQNNIIFFVCLALLKTFLAIFVIGQWLNDYYELRKDRLIHKNGVIIIHEDSYNFSHIKAIGVEQGILGRVFNFGTINFYDWNLMKYGSMYLIHNPLRYLEILRTVIPDADVENKKLREIKKVEHV